MSIESVMPSSHLILCCPVLLLPPIPPSIRVFPNESTLNCASKVSPNLTLLPLPTAAFHRLQLCFARQVLLVGLFVANSSSICLLFSCFIRVWLFATPWTVACWAPLYINPEAIFLKLIKSLPYLKPIWGFASLTSHMILLILRLLFSGSATWQQDFFFFNLTILYWFCALTWIRHGCTWVPNPEPASHLPPHIISLDHPRAPAPSILYRT